VPGDGLHIVWPEVVGEIRGHYFLLSGQKLSAAEAKEYGAVNEVVSREALLPRAWELARHMKKQNRLTLRYTRMALSNRFRRRLQEGLSYGRGRHAQYVRLTGRRVEADRVMGLELAADDYLTKPFSPREPLARIRAVLRRRRREVQPGHAEGIRAKRFDGWELNLNARRLRNRGGQMVPLSNGEFSLLVVLLGAPNRVLSCDQVLDMSRLHRHGVYNRPVDSKSVGCGASLRPIRPIRDACAPSAASDICSASRSKRSANRHPG
jgi:CheY-like chemotaxis protein